MAFHGTFEHSLDTKNRLTVPAKFRAALAGKVFLVRGVDPCISLYPEAVYTALTEAALSGLNPFSPQARELKRMLYGNATDTELDSAGRVMLTPKQARARRHGPRGRHHRRRRLPRALGPLGLGGLRPRPLTTGA